MYIPLDNLYEWISGISRDILIYRFFPHGSRNLEDLRTVNDTYTKLPWLAQKQLIPVICNDQEPLNYNYYNISSNELQELSSTSGLYNSIYHLIKNNQSAWDFLAQKNLASVIMPSINDRVILLHSEKNSNELVEYEKHGFIGAFWWSHAMIARDWYRYAEYDPLLTYPEQYQFDFNIYSRAWQGTREYRLKFLELISNLYTACRITFSDYDDYHYQQHNFKNDTFEVDDLRLTNTITESSYSASYDAEHYQQCAVDVVLETLFDDSRIHLTEKILRPIACGKPFILVSTPGSLKYLKEYGFKTFEGLIDETYDLIDDPLERLTAIAQAMEAIANLDTVSKQTLWEQMKPICEHNQKLFFSDQFANHVQQELWHNVQCAEKQIKEKYQTGRNFICWKKLLDKETYKNIIQIDDKRRDVAQLLKQCRQRQTTGLPFSIQPSQSGPGSLST